MNREDMYYALSEISDTFISEANEVRDGDTSGTFAAVQKRRMITFVSGAMAAACACVCALTLAIVLPMQNKTTVGDIPNNSSPGTSEPNIGDGNTVPGTYEPGGSTGDSSGGRDPSGSDPSGNGNDESHAPGDGNVSGSSGAQDPSGGDEGPGSMPIYGVGSVQSGKHGSVRFASKTEYSATFEFDITSDVPYDSTIIVTFMQYYEENKTPRMYRITTSDYDYGGERLPTDMLKLTVNGELSPQYKMPDKVGHYVVVFDYSAVSEAYDNMVAKSITFTSLQEVWFTYSFTLII